MLGSCVRDREAPADGQGPRGDRPRGARACAQFAGSGRITAPGSSWPQSMRIVQRKRRPTSKVDSMIVLRARRGGTGSKYVTLRGGLRRAIPFLLVGSSGRVGSALYGGKRPGPP